MLAKRFIQRCIQLTMHTPEETMHTPERTMHTPEGAMHTPRGDNAHPGGESTGSDTFFMRSAKTKNLNHLSVSYRT